MQFKLPELGEGVHEGELVKWQVKVGDTIKYDQPLCEIMTDKATVEIPSAVQGQVAQLHVKEGEIVKVGQLMLSFEGAAGASVAPSVAAPASSKTPSSPSASREEKQVGQPAQVSLAGSSAAEVGRVLAAPSARRLAREMGVELTQVSGTGPHGRVMREDLLSKGQVSKGPSSKPALAPSRLIAPALQDERVPLRGLRKKIAEKMRLSKDRAAHFTYVEEADATQLVALRNAAKELGAKQGIKVTFLPFVMKAMIPALRAFPIVNSNIDDEKGEIVYRHVYNIGLSIQTEDGLTAPVVKDVANKSILQLAREIQDLVDRARQKRLTMEDFQGGTITLTNAGSIGGLFATPIINYPEVAILGFNKIFRKPVAKIIRGREKVVIRDWTYFSISLDHRVVDGAVGAEFMKMFIQYIENPNLLLLESL